MQLKCKLIHKRQGLVNDIIVNDWTSNDKIDAVVQVNIQRLFERGGNLCIRAI